MVEEAMTMSKLQKSALLNLSLVTVFALISTACILFLASINAKGVVPWLIGFFVCLLLSPGVYILYRKKSLQVCFEQRERMIDRRAFVAAAIGLAIFLGRACTLPFAVLGGKSLIKVYYPPLIFISAVLTAQLVHSAAVLVMCALEGNDG
jgi:hypothetical protein